MRYPVIVTSLWMFVLSSITSAGQGLADLRQRVAYVLDGEPLVVRVYEDWRQNPTQYRLVTATLDKLNVRLDMRDAPRDVFAVITADDQEEEVLKTILDDCIYVGMARNLSNGSVSIWADYPGRLYNPPAEQFRDVLGNPLSNASVEMWYCPCPVAVPQPLDFDDDRLRDIPKIPLGVAQLDELGQLQPPRLLPMSLSPLLVVVDANFGKVLPYNAGFRGLGRSRDRQHGPFRVPILPKEKWCVFRDALGNPIPSATIVIRRLGGSPYYDRLPDLITTTVLDEHGRAKPPALDIWLRASSFIVSHPDYGLAIGEPADICLEAKPLESCIVPLVPRDSPAYARSVHGTVVGPDEKPIPGAVIECPHVALPGMSGMIESSRSIEERPFKSLTNVNGRFSMYLPIERNSEKHGNLIPLTAQYRLTIKAPDELKLSPCSTSVSPGENPTIKMSSSQPEPVPAPQELYPHTFLFEDKGRIITDPNILKDIQIYIVTKGPSHWFENPGFTSTNENEVSLRYDQWSTMDKFPDGRYSVTNRKFSYINVTPNSPEVLVFRAFPAIVQYGQVVYAHTSTPAANVVVAAMKFGKSASMPMTDETFKLLSDYASGVPVDAEELDKLKRDIGFVYAIRTDSEGHYRFEQVHGESSISKFVAFEENYICSPAGGYRINEVTDEIAAEMAISKTPGVLERQLPPIRLFPAATLIVEPNSPSVTETAGYNTVELVYLRPEGPSWISDFLSLQRHTGIYVRTRFPVNMRKRMYVPADTSMTLEFIPRKELNLAKVTVPDVKLKQGEVLDLGTIPFRPKIEVLISVVDATAKPLEGIPVRYSPRPGTIDSAISDENGLATFRVEPNSTAEFSVTANDTPSKSIQESMTCSIAGQSDQGKTFYFVLSEAMASRFRK